MCFKKETIRICTYTQCVPITQKVCEEFFVEEI